MAYFSLAFGTATKNRDGKIIEAFFPSPVLNPSEELVNALAPISGYEQ
ncbi:2,3,4,5-tetrahydropyridine-2,6-dicarboxylate N-succinyltransferase, partial [Vibrio campbellii]